MEQQPWSDVTKDLLAELRRNIQLSYIHTAFCTEKPWLQKLCQQINLASVLDAVVRMVNFVKTRPLKSRIFHALCKEMEAEYTALLLHTEVR